MSLFAVGAQPSGEAEAPPAASRDGYGSAAAPTAAAEAPPAASRESYGSGDAMVEAAERGELVEVCKHLANGCDANFVTDKSWTALHRASAYGQTAVVEVLLDFGADVDCRDRNGVTPLMCAALQGHYLAVKRLLAAGARVELADLCRNTALSLAKQGRGVMHEACVEVLEPATATSDRLAALDAHTVR